ncbi:hypothetical protein K402DRAFT_163447 [Aulographum hederae CBS 113979]|uniref:Uncharacterized protein n=1 Tax=Aulographum hederae CBS 113979 TaxID=1176131 RepID=A0A6G1GRF4_9PEZI|nr:hypothetical protein K402DRAFT_163447 [Aulographum hederae CBS 113979]
MSSPISAAATALQMMPPDISQFEESLACNRKIPKDSKTYTGCLNVGLSDIYGSLHGTPGRLRNSQAEPICENMVDVTLTTIATPGWTVAAELNFDVYYFSDKSTIIPASTRMSLRMNERHIKSIQIRNVKPPSSSLHYMAIYNDVKIHFPNIKDLDRFIAFNDLHVVKIDYNATKVAVCGCNFFVDHQIGGPISSKIRQLQSKFRGKTQFILLFRSAHATGMLATFKTRLEARRETSLLQAWWPRSRGRVEIDHHTPRPRRRGVFPLRHSYDCIELLSTAMLCGAMYESEALYAAAAPCEAALRVQSLPGCGNRQYFAYMEEHTLTAHPSIGDEVTLCFEGVVDDPSYRWIGRVLEPLPQAKPNEISLFITRPYDEDEREWLRVEIPAASWVHETKSSMDADLRSITSITAKIRNAYDNIPLKRQIHGLRQLQEHATPSQTKIMLGNDLENIEKRNFFEKVPSDDVQLANVGTTKQGQIVNALRDAPGGMTQIQTQQGTDKCIIISQIIKPLVMAEDDAAPANVLVCAASNTTADGLARNLNRMILAVNNERSTPRYSYVVRLHSGDTENAIVRRDGDRARQRRGDAPPPVLDKQEMEQAKLRIVEEMLLPAQKLLDLYHTHCHQPYDIDDLSLKEWDLAMGVLMLYRAGAYRNVKHPIEHPDAKIKYAGFRNNHDYYFGRSHFDSKFYYAGGIVEGPDAWYNAHCKELFNEVASNASVIVTTFSNALDSKIYESYSPRHLVVEEAEKILSLNFIALWAALPSLRHIVQFAGPKLERPKIQSTVHDNPFALQLGISFFERNMFNGFPTLQITEESGDAEEV